MNPFAHLHRPRSRASILALLACVISLVSTADVFSQGRTRELQNPTSGDPVPKILLLRILRAEDERRWDDDLRGLFLARNGAVRERAALAAGRIGDENAVSDLITLLQRDDEPRVRAMAAFALGEIESPSAADALLATLKNSNNALRRARSVEALGKIAAALPPEQQTRARELGSAILDVLRSASEHRSAADRLTILLGLTATLRAKPANAGAVVADFLDDSDPRIRADAANTLARLRLKDGNDQLRKLLTTDPDPIVRANAARVLGATEHKASFEALLDRALRDSDSRVRVSAIRALAALKDPRATKPLLNRADILLDRLRRLPAQKSEMLEIATTIGLLFKTNPELRMEAHAEEFVRSLALLGVVANAINYSAPELEIARARVDASYAVVAGGRSSSSSIETRAQETLILDWRAASSMAQGLAELAGLTDSKHNRDRTAAEEALFAMLDYRNSGLKINTLVAVHSEYAIPDVLRGYAAFKPKDLADVLRRHLKESDVIIRSTAAELLGELPPDESNTNALIAALPAALADKELNDAALAILDSLAKQKNAKANEAIKTALDSQDYLVRRKAVAVLKANSAGDFSSRIGTVQTRNTVADYERAIARMDKPVTAIVTTNKGLFTINLLPDEATLNVDNFIQLARRKYFNGITVHRVVPNFVIQDGDPRGDGNGGPGYQIRCEINEVPYERGAVGMALSGKDTGGSQWFVTHSPQPHLDGGYTVFGNVIAGMATVDAIVRGDVIRSIVIKESVRRGPRPRR